MSTPALNGFESGFAASWLRSGMPILKGLRNAPTLYLTFGRPKETVDNKGLTNVQFENMWPIDPVTKLINFNLRYEAESFSEISRGQAMLAADTSIDHQIEETLQSMTAYFKLAELIPHSDLEEGTARSGWKGDATYEQWKVNAMMENYVKQTGQLQFATGTSANPRMPGDGVLGSFRAQISDGMNSSQRGSGGDESAYRYYLGKDRASDPRHSAYYYYASGSPAYTEDIGATCQRAVHSKGANRLLFPMNNARFTKFEARIRSAYPYLIQKAPDDLMYALGGMDVIKHNNCIYYHEPMLDFQGATTWMIGIDPEVIGFGSNYMSLNFKLKEMEERLAAWKIWALGKHQLLVTNPSRCVLIDGLESK